jgi:hypothetical protein
MLIEVATEGEGGVVGSITLGEGGVYDLNLVGGNAEVAEACGGHFGIGVVVGEIVSDFDGTAGAEDALIVADLVEFDGLLEGSVVEPAFEGHIAIMRWACQAEEGVKL